MNILLNIRKRLLQFISVQKISLAEVTVLLVLRLCNRGSMCGIKFSIQDSTQGAPGYQGLLSTAISSF
jgi:hypothetical protein